MISYAAEEGNIEMLDVLERITGIYEKNEEGYLTALNCADENKKIKVLKWLKDHEYPIYEHFLKSAVATQSYFIVEWMKEHNFFTKPKNDLDE